MRVSASIVGSGALRCHRRARPTIRRRHPPRRRGRPPRVSHRSRIPLHPHRVYRPAGISPPLRIRVAQCHRRRLVDGGLARRRRALFHGRPAPHSHTHRRSAAPAADRSAPLRLSLDLRHADRMVGLERCRNQVPARIPAARRLPGGGRFLGTGAVGDLPPDDGPCVPQPPDRGPVAERCRAARTLRHRREGPHLDPRHAPSCAAVRAAVSPYSSPKAPPPPGAPSSTTRIAWWWRSTSTPTSATPGSTPIRPITRKR